ncbi:MAG: hypothetical protein Q9208_007575 [Pyrenodesmia sp. 3 TL-2023]
MNKNMERLNEAQRVTSDKNRKKDTFAHILGPPDSGKAYLISKMVQVGALAGKTRMVIGPSNRFVDNVAGTINADAPHIDTIRLHSLRGQSSRERSPERQERKDKTEEDSEALNQQHDEEDAGHEKRQLYTELVQYTLTFGGHKKRVRPNVKSMSLMDRVLERCGMDGSDEFDDKIEVITRIRKVFKDGPVGDYGEKGYKKTLRCA